MSTRIYLIRHAETEPDDDDATLWPLSQTGEQQVKQLAAQPFWDEVTAIVSSTEMKAIATVQGIAFEHSIPLFTHDGLRELRRTPGLIDNYSERAQQVFEKPAISIGNWERAADAQARIMACLDELIARFGQSPFAVVSHGMVLALLLAALQDALGYTYEIWESLGFASVTLIERNS
ncbi:MAG: histidine phosphatase family protein [Chloroflexi bacterium]|nr:histidine phosphatase family protein [Chloroflexota bacterium]